MTPSPAPVKATALSGVPRALGVVRVTQRADALGGTATNE